MKMCNDQIRKVLITGATSGIGKELCNSLKNNNQIIFLGRSKEKLCELRSDLGDGHIAICNDLESKDDIEKLDAVLPTGITDFVHCAGKEFVAPISTISLDKCLQYFNLHVFSYLEIIKSLARNKKTSDEYITNVVLLSSTASDDGGAMQSLYSSSKAAAEALSKPLSRELSRKNFRINSIKAGLVETAMTERWAKKIGVKNVDELQLNGAASSSQIVDLVRFLLNSDGRHINGSSIRIDGGGALSTLS